MSDPSVGLLSCTLNRITFLDIANGKRINEKRGGERLLLNASSRYKY